MDFIEEEEGMEELFQALETGHHLVEEIWRMTDWLPKCTQLHNQIWRKGQTASIFF